MLLILTATASELGDKCREYLNGKGFETVEKYSYAEKESLPGSRNSKRNYVDEKTFYSKTDSLFRYRIAGDITVGFSWDRISEAVYGDKNMLLTFSSDDMSMLRRIRETFGEKVYVIYCYVDVSALEGLFTGKPGISEGEFGERMEIGLKNKKGYIGNADLFDSAVIYGGEGSLFNYQSLYRQFDAILNRFNLSEKKKAPEKYDVFFSYSVNMLTESQRSLIEELKNSLRRRKIRVFDYDEIPLCGDFSFCIEDALKNAEIFIPFLPGGSSGNGKSFVDTEIREANRIAESNGLVICPVVFDGKLSPKYESLFSSCRVLSAPAGSFTETVENALVSLLTGEAELKNLSEKTAECISSSLYAKAFELQKSYCSALEKYLSARRREGPGEKINAMTKLLFLAAKTDKREYGKQTACRIVWEYRDETSDEYFKKAADSLADFCLETDTSADEMRKIIENNSRTGKVCGKMTELFNRKAGDDGRGLSLSNADTVDSVTEEKIAAYTKASIKLFEYLFSKGETLGYRETLVYAYNRIIDYCRSASIANRITEMCIDRISELKEKAEGERCGSTESGEKVLRSLKVYLGQALPDTGKYDVFISHCSGDDNLADRVFDYLKDSGYEVFCDHRVLGKAERDSNYDKCIIEALDNSKHLILIASDPGYTKHQWVHFEWHLFFSQKRENLREGNLLMVFPDEIMKRKRELPSELQDGHIIIKMSRFRDELTGYLW